MYNTQQHHRAASVAVIILLLKQTYLCCAFNGFRFALLHADHPSPAVLRLGLAPFWPLIFHQSPSSQEGVSTNHSRFRLRWKQSITGKENNCKCTIDAADFPQKSYIFFSFWNWQLTKSTTCGKSFITLGLDQAINNGLLCQNCTGIRGTINYCKNKKKRLLGRYEAPPGDSVEIGLIDGCQPKKCE